ncbi:uncharacterized protein LOC107829708 isoform X1 [Nicotiana tabacum]|uniref:Uncharacterized protein n=1 Tax=Nicotiana tabacum TaxID=4097 RepID=A0A1S4DHC0_TOBAC|nr:uncharacterized protein LOC104115658 [Nicotiana tomentosiformis]XP_009624628.1 uncharacterized protein LOC104115658 [Nicotiana tomentosiformis]XP_016512658.1 PREDICTED: uncharacterized protein LOC107829708 [Nicotiana tabacum]XP_016512659.1 PREDICTED: uncharacterized protein LOC107829708 [Nicotiana tabacum]XP_016512660.1 PREDICTED: uncharacterized protein LOC107829708 [Nicotiana tabacum]
MKESSLMRVLFCKIHCPFICFCKPSAAHLYTSGPLKLESGPHVTPTLVSDQQSVAAEVKEESPLDGNQLPENDLKSCIRKSPNSSKEIGKKRVQWMDNIGKELAEIKEFESSETGDTDTEEETRHCLCIIL